MRRSMAKMAGGLAGVAIMGSALGAELSEEARPDLSPWAGPYAGLSIGAQSADNRWQTTSIAPAVGSNAFVPSAGTSGDMDSTAMAVGGYLGINWRLAPTWVAGIEEHRHAPGTVTVLPMPGHTMYPHINTLIANRRWKINSLSLEPGRLSDVVHALSREAPL